MKLLTAGASPFANKVHMAFALAGIEVEAVNTDAGSQPPELIAANPLGKIPCLIDDDGNTMFDSRAITRHIHHRFKTKLYPSDDSIEAMHVARFEALCDGVCDCAVAHVYERRMRPEEKVHQPWLDRQWTKVMAGLKEMAKTPAPLGKDADIRTCAMGATLGYLALRFAGEWEADNPALVQWLDDFGTSNPDIAALKPRG